MRRNHQLLLQVVAESLDTNPRSCSGSATLRQSQASKSTLPSLEIQQEPELKGTVEGATDGAVVSKTACAAAYRNVHISLH